MWKQHRIFTLAAIFSVILFLLLLIMIPLSTTPWGGEGPVGWRLWDDVRIGNFGFGIALYNQGQPYTRSGIIGLKNDSSEFPKVQVFEFPGLYYHHFQFETGSVWWTLTLSRVYPIVLTSILPAAWLLRWHLHRQRSRANKSPN
jgi:hypothetical protein